MDSVWSSRLFHVLSKEHPGNEGMFSSTRISLNTSSRAFWGGPEAVYFCCCCAIHWTRCWLVLQLGFSPALAFLALVQEGSTNQIYLRWSLDGLSLCWLFIILFVFSLSVTISYRQYFSGGWRTNCWQRRGKFSIARSPLLPTFAPSAPACLSVVPLLTPGIALPFINSLFPPYVALAGIKFFW